MAEDFEERLRRYRPAGPAPALRGRIVQPADTRPAWPWAAAAAALLAVTVLLRAGAASLGATLEPPVDPRRAAVDELTIAMGGDSEARVLAETLALQEEVRALAEPAPEGSRR